MITTLTGGAKTSTRNGLPKADCNLCFHSRTKGDLMYCEVKRIDCSVRSDGPCSHFVGGIE